MLKKSFIPIICILLFYPNLSYCFLPFYSNGFFENIVSKFEVVPEFGSNVLTQTIFYGQNDNNQDDDYFENLVQFENNLEQEQEDFIKTIQSTTVSSVEQTVNKIQEIEESSIYIELNHGIKKRKAEDLIQYIASFTMHPVEFFKDLNINNNLIIFRVDVENLTAQSLVNKILKYQLKISKELGVEIVSCGLVKDTDKAKFQEIRKSEQTKEILIIFAIVSLVAMISLLIIVFLAFYIRKKFFNPDDGVYVEKKGLDDEECLINESKKDDSRWLAYVPFIKSKKTPEKTPSQDYQDLCRQRMQSKVSPINSSINTNLKDGQTPALPSPANNCQVVCTSNTINSTPIRITDNKADQSRNSSWLEDSMCHFNIDITTGHAILSYMEKYLNDKDLINKDWKHLTEYVADESSNAIASLRKNYKKNRYQEFLPYDFSLVKLRDAENNYINASFIIDDDPKNPAYIATQSPLQETSSEFWQMIWENQTVVIVNLSNNSDSDKCFQYWPDKGFKIYNKYEIHFASEHVWNDDFLVRNFFFKNVETDQTRTITQYQYLTWSETEAPSIKTYVDFRRKVNKSYTSKTCPIVVHCNDGVGRTGTYILIDMVLNKISKGAKEIDLAATVEFLRDQRPQMIRYKSQYEFSFELIIQEVKNYLNYIGN